MREEVIWKWKEKYADILLEKRLKELEETFQKNYKEWREQSILEFQKIVVWIMESKFTGKIGYFIYTLLRTRIISHDYRYRIYFYEKEWYMGEAIEGGEVDFSFIYKFFEALWEDLLLEARSSRGLIGQGEIEYILLEYIPCFHKYVLELLRSMIPKLTELEEYQSLEKETIFEIQSGEWYEPCELVQIEGQEKNLRQIKKWLKEKRRKEYCFQDFKQLNFQREEMVNQDFQYTDFRGSNLDEADLSISLLIGSKWDGCSMKKANLVSSMIANASFDRADLKEADFSYCVTFVGKKEGNTWRKTGFTGTSFRESDLRNSKFFGATLNGVDFQGASLEGSVFTNSSLYGSKMSKEQMEESKLTKEQVEQIIKI